MARVTTWTGGGAAAAAAADRVGRISVALPDARRIEPPALPTCADNKQCRAPEDPPQHWDSTSSTERRTVGVNVKILDPRTNEIVADQDFDSRDEAGEWAKAQAWSRSDESATARKNIDECWAMTEEFSVPIDVALRGLRQTAFLVTEN